MQCVCSEIHRYAGGAQTIVLQPVGDTKAEPVKLYFINKNNMADMFRENATYEISRTQLQA